MADLLHFPQQLPGQLAAGGMSCGLDEVEGCQLSGGVETGEGLLFGRKIHIAGQHSPGVFTEAFHPVH